MPRIVGTARLRLVAQPVTRRSRDLREPDRLVIGFASSSERRVGRVRRHRLSDQQHGALRPGVAGFFGKASRGGPLLSWVALTRPLSQERKPNVRTPPIRQLTNVSRPLSLISDAMPRPVRRRRVCLRSIPPLQSLRGSPGAGKQIRSY